MTVFRIRNIVSGLYVPTSVRSHGAPLTFETYEDAQLWLVHIDAPVADFAIEECDDDGER